MKKVVWIAWETGLRGYGAAMSSAYLGREQIAETLSSVAVKEIIGVVLAYAIKSVHGKPEQGTITGRISPDPIATAAERKRRTSQATTCKEGKNGMTENQLRQKVVKIAVSYLGCKEADGATGRSSTCTTDTSPLPGATP